MQARAPCRSVRQHDLGIVAEIDLRLIAGVLELPCRDEGAALGLGDRQFGLGAAGDRFGETLTIAKLGADFFEDLVIGVPGDRVGTQDGAGSVHVFMSKSFGVDLSDQMVLTQSFIHSGSPEAGDEFGAALSNGDYNGDGFEDLAIGVPFEDIDNDQDCGAVHIVYSSLSGPITESGVQLWSQGASGVDGTRKDSERFGSAVR